MAHAGVDVDDPHLRQPALALIDDQVPGKRLDRVELDRLGARE